MIAFLSSCATGQVWEGSKTIKKPAVIGEVINVDLNQSTHKDKVQMDISIKFNTEVSSLLPERALYISNNTGNIYFPLEPDDKKSSPNIFHEFSYLMSEWTKTNEIEFVIREHEWLKSSFSYSQILFKKKFNIQNIKHIESSKISLNDEHLKKYKLYMSYTIGNIMEYYFKGKLPEIESCFLIDSDKKFIDPDLNILKYKDSNTPLYANLLLKLKNKNDNIEFILLEENFLPIYYALKYNFRFITNNSYYGRNLRDYNFLDFSNDVIYLSYELQEQYNFKYVNDNESINKTTLDNENVKLYYLYDKDIHDPPLPIKCVLLPVTLPIDIVTFPIQYLVIRFFWCP